MVSPIVKRSSEFKDTVVSMVRAMPLDEMLLVPASYIDKGIEAWLAVDPDTGISPAQEDYKHYFQFIMTIPKEMHVLDMDLYYLRIAKRIVDNILMTMLDTSYYKSVFGYADVEKEQYELIYALTNDVLDRLETTQDGRRAYKNTKELREEFEKYFEEVLSNYDEES